MIEDYPANIAQLQLHGTFAAGRNALVDVEDLELVRGLKWHMDSKGYVYARTETGARLLLHRLITGDNAADTIDHKNGDRLDHRRANLRPATFLQNGANKGRASNNTSGYKGVSFDAKRKKWRAYIKPNGKHLHLGRYETPEQAAAAYNGAAIAIFGNFARLNEIPNFEPEEKAVLV